MLSQRVNIVIVLVSLVISITKNQLTRHNVKSMFLSIFLLKGNKFREPLILK